MDRKQRIAETMLLLFCLLATAWYLFDAYQAEASVENLILIMPVGALVICLCCWSLLRPLTTPATSNDQVAVNSLGDKCPAKTTSVTLVMLCFSLFIISSPWIGFDVATFLFVGSLLAFQGERRPHILVGLPFTFTLIVAFFFFHISQAPMPMLLSNLLQEWF